MPVTSKKIYRNVDNQKTKTHAELVQKGHSDAEISDWIKDGIIEEVKPDVKKKDGGTPLASNGKETQKETVPVSSSTGKPTETEVDPAKPTTVTPPGSEKTTDVVPAQKQLTPPVAGDPLANTDYTPEQFKNPVPGANAPVAPDKNKTPGSYDFLKDYYEKQSKPLFHSDMTAQDQHGMVDRVTKQQFNTELQIKAEPKRKAVTDKVVNDILDQGSKSKFMTSKRPLLDPKPFAPDVYYGKLNLPAVDSLLASTNEVTVKEGDKEVKYQLDDRDKQEIRNRVISWFPQAKDAYDLFETTKKHYTGLKDEFGHNTDPLTAMNSINLKMEDAKNIKLKEAEKLLEDKKNELQGKVNNGKISVAEANEEIKNAKKAADIKVSEITSNFKARSKELQEQVNDGKITIEEANKQLGILKTSSYGNIKEATRSVSIKADELQKQVSSGRMSVNDANAELTRFSTSVTGSLDEYIKSKTGELTKTLLPNLYKSKIDELTKERDKHQPNTVSYADSQRQIDEIQKKIDGGDTYKLEDDPKWQSAMQSAYKTLLISKNEQAKDVVDSMWRSGPNKQTTFNDMKNFAAKQVQGLFQGLGSTEQILGGILNMHGHYGIGNYWTDNGRQFAEVNQLPAPIDKNGNPQIFDDSIGTWVAKNVTAQIPLMLPLIAVAEAGGAALTPIIESMGLVNKATPFVSGAVGGLTSSVPEALMEAGDMYNTSIEAGKSTQQAEADGSSVFKKNMLLLGFSNPLEFGLMKIPGRTVAQKIFKAGLEGNINGAQEIVQNYFQEQELKPGLKLLDYATSPEGVNTYLSGMGVGILQNAVVGSLEHWQAGNATNKMFNYMNQHGGAEGSNLPSNYVIAKTMFNALSAHDSPKRVKQLHGIVDQYEQSGAYTPEEAERVKAIINDVDAVKGKVPQIVDPLRQTAILNELLKQKTINDAINSAGAENVSDFLKDDLKSSNERIKNIFTGDEPLYFVHGIETNKEQLTDFLNGKNFNKNIQVDIFNDKEATDLYNSKIGKKAKVEETTPIPAENKKEENLQPIAPGNEGQPDIPSIHTQSGDLAGNPKTLSMVLNNDESIKRDFGKLNKYDLLNKIHDEGYEIIRDETDDKLEPGMRIRDKDGNDIQMWGSKNLLNQVKYRVTSVYDKNGDAIFNDNHKDYVKESIDDGTYEDKISMGRMTANDAKRIIERVGLKVPKKIADKAAQEIADPRTITRINDEGSRSVYKKTVNGLDINEINGGNHYTLHKPDGKEYSRTDNLGRAEEIANNYKPAKTDSDANQKQSPTEVPIRNEASNGEEVGKGDEKLQETAGEGEKEKVVEPSAASVPVMITKKMESDLLNLGYTRAEIDKMRPVEAHDKLTNTSSALTRKPTYEEVKSGLNLKEDGETEMGIEAVTEWLKSSNYTLPYEKELISKYQNFIDKNIKVVFKKLDGATSGQAVTFNKKLESINIDPFKGTMKNSTATIQGTILHELTHALATRQGEDFNKLAEELIPLIDIAEKYFNKNSKELIDRYKTTEGKLTYGFSAVNEFVAEAMSNRKFQAMLSEIPYKSEAGSVWGKFVGAIRNYFSIILKTKDNNLLDQVVKSITTHIDKTNNANNSNSDIQKQIDALEDKINDAYFAKDNKTVKVLEKERDALKEKLTKPTSNEKVSEQGAAEVPVRNESTSGESTSGENKLQATAGESETQKSEAEKEVVYKTYNTPEGEVTDYGKQETYLLKQVKDWKNNFDRVWFEQNDEIGKADKKLQEKVKEVAAIAVKKTTTKEQKEDMQRDIDKLKQAKEALEVNQNSMYFAFEGQMRSLFEGRAKAEGIEIKKDKMEDAFASFMDNITERPGIEYNWDRLLADVADEIIKDYKPKKKSNEKSNASKKEVRQGNAEQTSAQGSGDEKSTTKGAKNDGQSDVLRGKEREIENNRENFKRTNNIDIASLGLRQVTDEEIASADYTQKGKLLAGKDRAINKEDIGKFFVDSYSARVFKVDGLSEDEKHINLHDVIDGSRRVESAQQGMARYIYQDVDYNGPVAEVKSQFKKEVEKTKAKPAEEKTVEAPKETDPQLKQAATLVFNEGIASPSLLQRRLKVSFNKADHLINQLEEKGIIGQKSDDPAVKREILVKSQQQIEDLFNKDKKVEESLKPENDTAEWEKSGLSYLNKGRQFDDWVTNQPLLSGEGARQMEKIAKKAGITDYPVGNKAFDSYTRENGGIDEAMKKFIPQFRKYFESISGEVKKSNEAAPKQELSEKEILAQELAEKKAALKQALLKSRGQLNIGIDPGVLTAGIDILGTYAKMGIFKFKEFIKDLVDTFGRDIMDDENIEAMKGVYAAFKQNNKELRPMMDKEDVLDDYQYSENDVEAPLPTTEKEVLQEINNISDGTVNISEQRTDQENADSESNVTSLEAKGEVAIAKAKSVRGRKQAGKTIEGIDGLVSDINDQLSLLGYYDTEGSTAKDETEIGNKAPERKFKQDMVKFSKSLAARLGWDHETDKKGKQVFADTNIPPAGGDGHIMLWKPGSKYGVYISIPVTKEYTSQGYSDDLTIAGALQNAGYGPILWRINDRDNKYSGGANQYVSLKDFTVGNMADKVNAAIERMPEKPYLTNQIKNDEDGTGNRNSTTQDALRADQSSVDGGEPAEGTTGNVQGKPTEALPGRSGEPGIRETGSANGSGENGGRSSGRDTSGNDSAGSGTVEGGTKSRASDRDTSEPLTEKEIRREKIKNLLASERNMVIPEGMKVAVDGTVPKLTANMNAIMLLNQLETEDRNATPEEKEELVKFVGWGGLANYLEGDPDDLFTKAIMTGEPVKLGYGGKEFNPGKPISLEGKRFENVVSEFQKAYAKAVDNYEIKRWAHDEAAYGKGVTPDFARKQLIAHLLPEDVFQSAKVSTFNAHYTDGDVIRPMWDLAKQLGFKGGTVLESSMGIGHFFGMMPQDIADNSEMIGVELDSLSGRLAKKLYPQNNILVKGFQDVHLPNNSVDFAIGNVPFADKGTLYDSKNRDIDGFSLHNYFIAKNLKLLKPGGMAILITSKSTMDNAASAKARRWFASIEGGNSDLIGAVRLPNNAFDKNAGTQVTTDIMVFKKRTSDIANTEPFFSTQNIRTEMIDNEKADIDINEYYVAHPENMIGEMKFAFEAGSGGLYGRLDPTLHAPEGTNVIAKVKERFADFPKDIYKAPAKIDEGAVKDIFSSEKAGKMLMQDGKVYRSEGEVASPVEFRYKTHEQAAKAYIPLRESVYPLLEAELNPNSTDEEIEAHRKNLNIIYDDFVKKHGAISNHANWLFDMDIDYPLVAALENVKNVSSIDKSGKVKRTKEVTKGDMLQKRVNFPKAIPTKADSYEDALRISMAYKGHVDNDYLASLMGVKGNEDITPGEAAKAEALSKGLVFENPTNGLLETPDYYLSGKVRTKLKDAKIAAENNYEFQRNVDALEKVQPENIPAGNIDFKIGVSYLPAEMYKKFAEDTLGINAQFNYLESVGQWEINLRGGEQDARNTQSYAVPSTNITGFDIMKDAMSNRTTTVWREGPTKGSKVVDEAGTSAASDMQAKINSEFQRYIKRNEDYRNKLEDIYNERFNNFVEPKTSLPPFDHYPGAVHSMNGKPFKLREHQMKAVLRAINNNTLLAHDVGTGKTFTQITIAMEMRRLGLAKKPMIVVKNSTLDDFALSFKKLYPTARILKLSKDEINAKNRKMFFGRIPAGDWDAVIVPQSQFDMMPDKPERIFNFMQEKIAEMKAIMDQTDDRFLKARLEKEMEALSEQMSGLLLTKEDMAAVDAAGEMAAKGSGSKSQQAKAKKEGKKIARLTATVQKMTDRKTDNIIDFDDMGVDALIIDESHSYKRLGFQTNIQKVKGIDIASSKKAVSAYLKTQAIMEKSGGKNVVFATGTPITNTMAELWTNMRFLIPETVKEMGINTFDQFQQTFTEITDSVEQNAGGNFEAVQRLSTFYNLPELVKTFRSFADVVSTDDIPEFKADPDNAPPQLKGGKAQTIVLPMTKTLKRVMMDIRDSYMEYKSMSGKEKKENSYRPLLLYYIGKVAPIDPRIINPFLDDDPGSKANAAVANALRLYKEYDKYKATQMIFSDSIASSDAEKIREILRIPRGGPEFNLYQDMRDKLIKGGVPANEIAILTDKKYDKDEAKKKLFDMVNEGTVRILIGSTEKMGVGVNAQERMIGLHHVDAPARPDLFTQRNGRIIRQGNMFAKLGIPVEVLAYGMEGTRDATAFQRLEKKQNFITQMFKGEITERKTEDAAAEEEGNIDDFFAELGASLSGNKDAMKLVLVKKDLRKEENRYFSHEQKMIDAGNSLRRQQGALPEISAKITAADEALVNLEKYFPDRKIKSLTLNNSVVTEKLAEELENKVIKPLLNKVDDVKGKADKEIERSTDIKINDAEATVIAKGWSDKTKDFNRTVYLRSRDLNLGTETDELKYSWQPGRLMNTEGGTGMLQIVRNEFNKIEDNPEKLRSEKLKKEANIERLKQDLEEKFDDSKLKQLQKEKVDLEKSILASGDMKRYKVQKLDDDTFFIKDTIGGLEHSTDDNNTIYYKTEADANTIADQLNRDFAKQAETIRYVVGPGDEVGSYSIVDREDGNKAVLQVRGAKDLAQLEVNIRNDEMFGSLRDRKFYPVTYWNTNGYIQKREITIGQQEPVDVDEENRAGYQWKADKNFAGKKDYTFKTLKEALEVADKLDREANPQNYLEPKKTIDEKIEDAKAALKEELRGQLGFGAPINAIPQLTKLAWLYIQKGTQTASEFAKEIGSRLTKEVKTAWDDATQHWRNYQKTGTVPAGFAAPTPAGSTAGGNTPGATPSPQSTMAANAKKRADAAKEAQDKWKEVEQKLFGSETIGDDFYTKRRRNPIASALNLPNTIQDATFGTITDTFSKGLKRLTEKGLQNKNKTIRSIAKGLNNVFANMGKTTQDILAGEKFAGESKVRSINDAVKISEELRSLVDNDKASLNKVQRLLDPEFFKELSQDEFEEAMQVDMDDVQFAKMKQSIKDEMYKEYRKRMGFDEPSYKSDITIDDLTPAEQKLHELIRLLYDTMHEMNFAMGKLTIDTYDKNKGVYSARLYDLYEIPKEAEEAIKGSSLKMDESLYKEKGDVTAWKLLHRLDDPVYAVTKRLYQTLANKAIIDYADYIVKNKPGSTSGTEQPGYRKLGFGYGALSGKYVRNDIAEDFIGHFYADALTQKFYDMVKGYDKIPIRQFYKKLFTVYNPGVHVGNVMGNMAFGAIVGVNPVRLIGNLPWAQKQAKEYSSEYRYLLSSGLLNSDITRQDLVRSLDELEAGTDAASDSKNPLAWVKDKMTKVYGATDDLFKMAAFKSLVEQGYSAKEAMDRVKQGFQNYMRVGKAYDLFSKVPLVGQPFGKFGGDLARIVTNGITTHPLTTYAFLMFIKAMANLSSYLSGEDDKERKIREARAGYPHIPVPDFLGGDIPLAFKVGDNELNVARILSPLYLYSTTSGDEAFAFWNKLSPQPIDIPEWTKNPGGMVAATIAQNANDPIVAPILQLLVNSDFRGVPIIDPKETKFQASTLTTGEKIGNSLRFLARSYTPYGATGDDFVRALMDSKDYYGRERTPGQVALSFLGGVKIIQFPDEKYNKIVEQKMDSYGFQFQDEARTIGVLTKQVNTGEIDWPTYEKRVAPHFLNQAEIAQKARDEYKKLTDSEGGFNLKKQRVINSSKANDLGVEVPEIDVPKVEVPDVSPGM